MIKQAFVVGSAVLLAGCLSTPVQTADTLGKGDFQFSVEPGVFGVASSSGGGFLPSFNVSGRFGLSDKLDFGARLGTSTYEIWVKYMFTETDADGPILSIVPTTTLWAFGAGDTAAGFFQVKVPVLIGFGSDSQFVLGPYLNNLIAIGSDSGSSAGGYTLIVGTSVGYAARVGSGFRIMPEIGVGYPLLGAVGTSDGGASAIGADGVLLSFTLGFLVGDSD